MTTKGPKAGSLMSVRGWTGVGKAVLIIAGILLGLSRAQAQTTQAVCEMPYSVTDRVAIQASCPGTGLPDPVPVIGRNAVFTGQSVPGTMVVGQTYAVSVRMRNEGSMVWTASDSFRLGSQNPGDNITWGTNRVDVPGSVANGQEAVFNFTVRAPSQPGLYAFQWKMVQDGVMWFGGQTTITAIIVKASEVIGNIDIVADGHIFGWACSTGIDTPIDVHLYVGGPYGTGAGMGSYRADQSSEPGVAAACQNNGSAHRYSIPLTANMVNAVTGQGGKPIYIYGISPVGGSSNLLGSSGVHSTPVNKPPTMTWLSPQNGEVFRAPASIPFKAEASDPDSWDRVSKVALWVNGVEAKAATAAPYEFTLDNQPAGNYLLRAVAYDSFGVQVYYERTVTVAEPLPPTPPPPPPPPVQASAVRHYIYDAHQQLCKVIEPETGATVMAYDGAGNLQWTAAGLDLPSTVDCEQAAAASSGRRVDRSYDARNRINTLSFPDGRGNQVWSYTPDGLPAQVTTYNADNQGEPVINAYSYNKRRLPTGESVSQPGWYTWSLGYGYDANGHPASLVYPSGLAIGYSSNALGQVTAVRDGWGHAYASDIRYYPNGAIRQFTYGNGIVHSMYQNARRLPERIINTAGILDNEYTYDASGNVTSMIDRYDDNRSRWMTYDGLDRLTAAGSAIFGGSDHYHRFSYDTLDNIRTWTHAGIKDHRYYYDGSNRLTNVQNPEGATVIGLAYDVQGNLSNRNGQAHEFDYGNRLREVTGKESYRYDGHGRRALAWSPGGNILSMYSQAGQLVYAVEDANRGGKSKEHVYLGGSLVAIRETPLGSGSAAVRYQHTDALGSPVAVTDEMGQTLDRTNYEPYGAAIGKTVQGVGYTGHVMDAATGLTYMQQRYYDPTIGRFLSVDPIGADPKTGANFNRYKYANNNPYKFTDPDGRCEKVTGSHICANSVAKAAMATSARNIGSNAGNRYTGRTSAAPAGSKTFGPLRTGYVPAVDNPTQPRRPEPKPAGNGTIQIGLKVSGTLGPVSLDVSAGIAGDAKGGVAAYTESGAGGGARGDAYAGITVHWTNGKTVQDLAGQSYAGSGGGGLGPYVGGNVSYSPPGPSGNPVIGGGFTIGAGAGGGASGGITQTTIHPISED